MTPARPATATWTWNWGLSQTTLKVTTSIVSMSAVLKRVLRFSMFASGAQLQNVLHKCSVELCMDARCWPAGNLKTNLH